VLNTEIPTDAQTLCNNSNIQMMIYFQRKMKMLLSLTTKNFLTILEKISDTSGDVGAIAVMELHFLRNKEVFSTC
jgi:hypothetical protein